MLNLVPQNCSSTNLVLIYSYKPSLTFYFDFRAFQGGGFKLGSDTVASAAVSALN